MDAEELYYENIFQTAHVLNTAIEYWSTMYKSGNTATVLQKYNAILISN